MSAAPLVSICIPTYNGAPWIEGALRSALAQEYAPLEVVVVDDASTDATLEVVGRFDDPRLRVERNPRNVGLVRNWNRAVGHARGELVKLLFQDDLLHPRCVPEMAAVIREHPSVGMVFSRREVLLDEPDDPRSQAWKREYGVLDTQFERLGRINRGRDLFEQYLRRRFRVNMVGEPTCVLVRSEVFRRLGRFNARLHQGCDFEMWIRIMAYYDVGFLEQELASFRYHPGSTTSANHRTNRPWLDMLWLIEGLLRHPEIRRDYPQIARQRPVEWLRVLRAELRRARRGMPFPFREHARDFAAYWQYRSLRRAGREPDLHSEDGEL
ncbi:MAG: glycosyltransferase family 2 protein [Armatimonadota bacterium]